MTPAIIPSSLLQVSITSAVLEPPLAFQFRKIWSAGLFDYLPNRLFVQLLRRLVGMRANGGRVVIGNFSTQNPSRDYMELLGDWHLNHRSPSDLHHLAGQAGIDPANCEVITEPEGVNLFLVAHG